MGTVRVRVAAPAQALLVREGPTLAQAVKRRLALALADAAGADGGLQAALLPAGQRSASCTVFLSDDQVRTLGGLAAGRGLSPAAMADALLWSAMQPGIERARPGTTLEAAATLTPTGGEPDARAEQELYRAGLAAFCAGESPGVLCAEGSTGIGKTRAFLDALADWCAAHPAENAMVVVPTYQVMQHLDTEWQALGAQRRMPARRVVLGQSAFVSETALLDWLDAQPDGDALAADVRHWLARGCPPRPASLNQAAWSADGLEAACGGDFADLQDVLVPERGSEADAGYREYLLRSSVGPADHGQVLFATHAMLAVMVRERMRAARRDLGDGGYQQDLARQVRQWTALPPKEREQRLYELVNDVLSEFGESDELRLARIGLMVVDEAHELEQWFSRISSLQVSLWKVVGEMRSLKAACARMPAALVADAQRIFDVLRAMWRDTGDEDRLQIHAVLASLQVTLHDMLAATPAAKRQLPAARRLRGVSLMLDTALRSDAQRLSVPQAMRVTVDWSDARHWPRLTIGRRDVSGMLDFLWRHVAGKSILASATLYEDMPNVSAEAVRQMLAVPHRLLVQMPPVRPQWLFTPVTLYAANLTYRGDGMPRFVRPKREPHADPARFEAAYAAWIEELTRYTGQAWHVAAGGMLVLMTSYADLQALHASLQALCGGIRPLLAQQEGRPLARLKAEFLEAARAGERPLMLCVGAAWTGLSLWDEAVPDALTDLVIPLAPFGVGRSVTQQERERRSVVAAAFNASMILRQGLGRLVRSPRTPANRKIHFLDARRHLTQSMGLYAPMTRWLAKYQNRVEV